MIVKRILTEIRELIAKEEKIELTDAICRVTNEYGSLLNTCFIQLRKAAGLPPTFDEKKPSPLLSQWQMKKTKKDLLDLLDKALSEVPNDTH